MREDRLAHYLTNRAISSPWRLEGDAGDGYAGCIVIPALAESLRLFHTLDALAANPPELLERFLVVVVVNHREDSPEADKADNERSLARLRRLDTPLRLACVDAASPGLELSAKAGGVGLARRIGLDLALPRLGRDGIMVSLDADTLVEADYLQAICDHFSTCDAGGAVIPFCHQQGATVAEERAITLYELFLRHYVLGLKHAGSPYAFHCVGSAMACTTAAYLKMGGINSRRAGEDFYFLQQLKRVAGIGEVSGTTVRPSARCSHRVPFGTGKSISRIVADGEEAQTFYRLECFTILKEWLALVERGAGLSAREVIAAAHSIDRQLAAYLREAGLEQIWERLRDNASGADAFTRAFHGWFDGLKTVRLIHHLSSTYPRCGAPMAVPPLLDLCGMTPPQGEAAQLKLLRHIQKPSHSS